MMLASFIATYGYFAVFIGAIFEGETVLVLGGLASHEGYLSLTLVLFSAFLGAITGDLSLFLLGKYKGEKIVNRYPKIKKRIKKPQKLIEKHRILIALGMRFMYGFRHLLPFTLGMSSISVRTFILFNFLSSLVWAFGIGMIGYLFGDFLEVFLGKVRHYEFRIVFFTILFLAVGYGIHKLIQFLLYKMDKNGGSDSEA